MRKNLKYFILLLFSLLVFSCGTFLLTHDFSPVVDDTKVEEKIEETNAATNRTLKTGVFHYINGKYYALDENEITACTLRYKLGSSDSNTTTTICSPQSISNVRADRSVTISFDTSNTTISGKYTFKEFRRCYSGLSDLSAASAKSESPL